MFLYKISVIRFAFTVNLIVQIFSQSLPSELGNMGKGEKVSCKF